MLREGPEMVCEDAFVVDCSVGNACPLGSAGWVMWAVSTGGEEICRMEIHVYVNEI